MYVIGVYNARNIIILWVVGSGAYTIFFILFGNGIYIKPKSYPVVSCLKTYIKKSKNRDFKI